jgi:hypothetical protein
MAACGEGAIAGEMAIALCFRGMDQLLAGRVWPVERDEF